MSPFLVPGRGDVGERVRFDAAEARHIGRARRLRAGAVLDAVDEAGRRLRVRLDTVGAAEAWGTVLAAGAAPAESPCAITLAQGLLKGDRMTWLIEKATELGVSRIVPVQTRRVVVRPDPGRPGTRQARWERVAREAVKQCGRGRAPAVDRPRSLAEVVVEARAHDAAWLCWEGGGMALAQAAREAGQPRRLLLLVGPEGGFAPDEVVLAEAGGLRAVGLGPRILRAESAGLTAIALCQFLFGDLGGADRALRSPGTPP
jgi:16S rRNA (uracil1498-N3)-methyltransferase